MNKNFILLASIIVILIVIYIVGIRKIQAPTIPAEEAVVVTATSTSVNTPAPAVKTQTSPSKEKSSAGVSVTNEGAFIISYENSGFKPAEFEIKKGASVRFMNNSTKAMRVATIDTTGNPIYQSLNQPKSVGKGAFYDYTFIDAGVYHYANQNNSSDRGTITVK